MPTKVGVIICAAGPSSRFGGQGDRPKAGSSRPASGGLVRTKPAFSGLRKKQFVDVAGRAVFLRSVELFSSRDDVKQILLGISQEDEELVSVKWGTNLKFFNVKTFFGGDERFDTVRKGLALVRDDIELIAVHDAARCCVTAELIDKVIAATAKSGAAIPACPVAATVKQVKDNVIIKTIDRSGLYEAQTPQVFERLLLKKAYENLENLDQSRISDDSQLVEALGHKITIVESDSSNIKITRQSDVPIAEAILKSRPEPKKGYIGPYAEAEW